MANSKNKRSGRRKKGRSGQESLSPTIFLAGTILTVIAIAALFLARGPTTLEPAGVKPHLGDIEVEVESALLRSGYKLDQIDIRRESGLLTYEVRGYMPPAEVLDRLKERLQMRFDVVEDDRRADTGEVLIYRNGALACMLRFETRERPVEPPPPRTGKPQVAIIMDDLGRNLQQAREVINLGVPVTLAILPGEHFSTDVALIAARSGYEVIVHVPMEPHSYPATNPGSDALLLGQSQKEIVRRVSSFFEKVPYAVGANNHMGSRFTEFEPGMLAVMEVMHEKGMFFIDSRTTGRSMVEDIARRTGVPRATRDIFLDNVADVDAIRRQIGDLIRLAEQRGKAIGICHPYPETIEALKQEAKRLRNGKVQLVFASKLVSS